AGGVLALRAATAALGPPRVPPEAYRLASTLLITDRRGAPLRFLTDERWRRHLWLAGDQIPDVVRHAFIAAEDRRFHRHPGVDPLAIIRAAVVNLRARAVVSGASTITQQLVKSALPPGPRTLGRKIDEALEAARLERALPKDEILALYLNRVDLGNNLLGVEAAARMYFGRRAVELDAAEAATLAALPKAPSLLDPWGSTPERLLARRNHVLGRMAALGLIAAAEAAAARGRPLGVRPAPPLEAPHLVDDVLASGSLAGRTGVAALTVDLAAQREVEAILASHRGRLAAAGASQAAAVVLDNRTLDVVALAGSIAHEARAQGFVNGAAAPRSAGSTLKPFLYGWAIDRGCSPASVLEDVERAYLGEEAEYLPLNFDRQAHGPVDLRTALGRSLNLPAVHLLERLGTDGLYAVLGRLGLLPPAAPPPDHYGLGLAVGNLDVRLLDLAAAFAAIANGGDFRPPRVLPEAPAAQPRRVFSPEAAFIVADVLADPLLRSAALASRGLPVPVALKTGTSTHYRDAWTVGFTDRYTVGVWTGNFDGRVTARLFGGEGAGPVFADIVTALHRRQPPAPLVPPDTVTRREVCSQSGDLPGPGCRERKAEWFVAGAEPTAVCAYHASPGRHDLPAAYAGWLGQRHAEGRESRYRLAGLTPDLERLFVPPPPAPPPAAEGPVRIEAEQPAPVEQSGLSIRYPLDRDRYVLARGEERLELRLQAVAEAPVASVTWFVDGEELASAGPPYTVVWLGARGRHRVSVADAAGFGDAIDVSIE
ncbi:MAG TPA: penicillin-binding protein 1C, partial [bacterium]